MLQTLAATSGSPSPTASPLQSHPNQAINALTNFTNRPLTAEMAK